MLLFFAILVGYVFARFEISHFRPGYQIVYLESLASYMPTYSNS